MQEKTKSMSKIEEIVLSYLWFNPYLIEEENFFLTEESNNLYLFFLEMKSKGLLFNLESLKVVCENENLIQKVFSFEEWDQTKYSVYFNLLKDNWLEYQVRLDCSKIIGITGIDDMEKEIDLIKRKINETRTQRKQYSLLKDAIESHKELVVNRCRNNIFYSSGDSILDQHLIDGFAPGNVTTLFADSGQGKSTYALNLWIKQVRRKIPNIYFSTELSNELQLDRFFANYLSIDIDKIKSNEDYDFLINSFDRIKVFDKSAICDKPYLSLDEIENIILKLKQEWGVPYISITIDLVSMVKEFSEFRGGNKADNIECAINRLNQIAKYTGCHFLIVVQASRDNTHYIPRSKEDLQRFRPDRNKIKSSGAYFERSRIVLSLFREYEYYKEYLPEEFQKEVESGFYEDIADITILKQTSGTTGGKIKYQYIGQRSKFIPIVE